METIGNTEIRKSRALVVLEYVLLALSLCVLALRTTLTEGLNTQSVTQPINIGSSVFSLLMSAVLIFSLLIWVVWSFYSSGFCYRFSGIEVGLILFVLAVVIAGFAASNKRDAITESVIILAPPLCAVLMVQLLDSQSKIKLVLIVITVLGIVSAYQCADQFFISNRVIIEQYEQSPQSMLQPLGIQPGTLQQWLFEHRLYTKGVHGFFTTSNSAGCFAMLALFAGIALLFEKIKISKSQPNGISGLVSCAIAVAIVFFGLVVTKSKGAIVAAIFAASLFIAFVYFANRLKRHIKLLLILFLLATIIVGGVVVLYGVFYGRLPGGNSMLVRWQYWCGGAKMYADHSLTGVGPGNFPYFYLHYKSASALESVSDPHNFPLSILSQYGPLGLIGFLAMIFIPLWRAMSPCGKDSSEMTYQSEKVFKKFVLIFLIVISLMLLIVRPFVVPLSATGPVDVMIYVIFILYITPLLVFVLGFWLLTRDGQITASFDNNVVMAALVCAVLGLLLHNLIDFAIFEPGISTALWMMLACIVALNFNTKKGLRFVCRPGPVLKTLAAAGGVVLILAYLHFVLIPVIVTAEKIKRALNEPESAHKLLEQAAEIDKLAPAALSLNGRFYLRSYKENPDGSPGHLAKAVDCLLAAVKRNPADYKELERLTEVYTLLARSSRQQKDKLYNKAFDSAQRAVELYPGLGRLRIELAEVAEMLGKTDVARRQYKKAVEIEDAFRRHFLMMYPNRQIFSRLGEEKYDYAKQKIAELD